MTEKKVIYKENSQQCDDCGEIKELRPYGPPGKTMICFDCAMKDEEGTKQRFYKYHFGD
jgi:hypothetical protein